MAEEHPQHNEGVVGAPTPMTPERWRVLDVILQSALACDPDRRDAFIRDACGPDEAMRREVASLLAAHDAMAHDFLERPAVEALGGAAPPATPNDQRAALADALAGRYAIEREIARGGMAVVYRARDLRHSRLVAIKVMRDEVAAAVGAERFLEEIRVTALLQHPNILPLFDSGSGGGRGLLWYAMPFVEGETLRSRLAREGRLPIDEALRIAREVADALEHAHARSILHRDVKPENVLLREGHALVADFGIALALEYAGGERLTRTGLTLGTPQYMAPEQAMGERVLDARADVYALGAVLYEMLAGEPPFAAESRQVALQRMLSEPPAALCLRRPEVPHALEAAVQRAMAKRPDQRFPSASAFAAALVAAPESADVASPRADRALRADSSPMPAAASTRRMVRARVAVYAALAGVGVGLTSAWAVARLSAGQSGSAPPAPPVAASADSKIAAIDHGGGAAADWRGASTDGLSLVVVDRTGKVQRMIPAKRPWTPRFSPDGRRVAYGAFGAGRSTSDLWVTDLDAGTTQRLTDDDGDSNDPQWSSDGAVIAYSVSGPSGKDVVLRPLAGGPARVVAPRVGTQFPSDWLRDGSALIVTEETGSGGDILVQPADGSAARPYAVTTADETAARVSPNGRWIAYTSNESGRAEVYLDSYPWPKRAVRLSQGGGVHPVWRGDGREIYYWRGDSLVAVQLAAAQGGAVPATGAQTVLFRAPYEATLNTMYDASAHGERFVIVRRGWSN